MPPSIPSTAPFAEDEIEALNRIVGRATPTQRAWRSRGTIALRLGKAAGWERFCTSTSALSR